MGGGNTFSVCAVISTRYWLHDLYQSGPIPGHGAPTPAAVFAECERGTQGLLPGLGSGVPAGSPSAVPQHAARAPGQTNLHGVLQLWWLPLHPLSPACGLRLLLLLSAHHHHWLLYQDQPEAASCGQAELCDWSIKEESQGQHHYSSHPPHLSRMLQSLPPQRNAVHVEKDTPPANLRGTEGLQGVFTGRTCSFILFQTFPTNFPFSQSIYLSIYLLADYRFPDELQLLLGPSHLLLCHQDLQEAGAEPL